MLFLLYALSSSTGSSSPSMFTKPPIGISFSSYEVSLPCFFQIVGPKPIANCLIFTLNSFATRKCPNSCIKIKNPNKNAILIIPTIKVSPLFYIIVSKKYANGAINRILSILSNIPPCPGIIFPKSFISTYLFILETAKSPICARTLNATPIPVISK